MRRQVINYSRKFPSHIRTHDFKLYQTTKSSFKDSFQDWKKGFTANMANYWQISLTVYGLFLFSCYTLYKTSDISNDQALLKFKGERHGIKWSILRQDKTLGRYDSILNTFENEEGGIRDLEFE